MPMRTVIPVACAAVMTLGAMQPARALDEQHYRMAREMIEKSIDYLRSQQDAETGGWLVRPGGPQYPAITGLVINGMLMEPDIDADDPAVARGVEFILGHVQENGGIYDQVLASYNTSISLSALALVNREDAAAAIPPAQRFIESIQWSDQATDHPETERVTESSPFYGGIGYGRHSRPDMSNLSLALQGLYDSGLDCESEAFKRALVFLQRTQMDGTINDMPYAAGSQQGGFIYATGENSETAGQGESKAGMIEETLSDGTVASRLRAYGSMTYAGFKSYIYADLERDDPRVQAAHDWIRRNYTLEENPGLGDSGMYYYFVTFSRALDAWGLSTVGTLVPFDPEHEGGISFEGNVVGLPTERVASEHSPTGWYYVVHRDWANDLIDRLAELQNEDGSFRSVDGRWMEDQPVLITAYSLLALQHAID